MNAEGKTVVDFPITKIIPFSLYLYELLLYAADCDVYLILVEVVGFYDVLHGKYTTRNILAKDTTH